MLLIGVSQEKEEKTLTAWGLSGLASEVMMDGKVPGKPQSKRISRNWRLLYSRREIHLQTSGSKERSLEKEQ